MELFKNPPLLQFEKTAVPFVRMTAAVDRWPEILISSLQQQAPYMGDYEMSAHIRHLDNAQGFGFGFLAVKPPTERPLNTQAGERPVPYLRVPFIVKDWQLLPFDLFMQQDTTWPMTEKRVREALFSADTFDRPAKMPGDSSIAKDLMPPSSSSSAASMGGPRSGTKLAGADFQITGNGEFVSNSLQSVYDKAYNRADRAGHQNPHAAAGTVLMKQPKVRELAKSVGATGIQTGPAEGIFRLTKKAERPLLCEALQNEFVSREDMAKAAEALGDEATAWAAERHSSVLPLLEMVADRTQEKTAAPLLEQHAPSVVQISRLNNGRYMVKAASADAFRVIEQEVDGAGARAASGGVDIANLAPGQSYTAVPEYVVSSDPPEMYEYEQVKEAGIYQLPSGPREKLSGAVLPLVSFTGEKRAGEWLVVSQDGYTVKTGSIAGVALGGIAGDVKSDVVQGHGFLMDPKTASASYPFHVTALVENQGVTEILVKLGGRSATLEVVPGLHGMVKTAESRYAVPSHFVFRSVPDSPVRVEGDAVKANGWSEKTAAATYDAVDIIGDRTGVYTLSSPLLRDINGSEYKRVKEAQALFVLGALGVEPMYAVEKLSHCRVHGPVTIRGCRPLTESTKIASAIEYSLEKIAEAYPQVFQRPCLIKEALEVDDVATVDKILGLNFLRPENVQMYVDYLPDLEKAVSQLADLLMAVRVGMRPLSEGAIHKALFSLEDTVQGLKTLAQTGPPDTMKTASWVFGKPSEWGTLSERHDRPAR